MNELYLQNIPYNGQVFFQAYAPAGWQASVIPDNQWVSNEEPTAHDLVLQGPDATLYFYPRAWFREGNSMRYGLNPMTFQNAHKYESPDQYIFTRIQESFPGAQITYIQKVQDGSLDQRAARFHQEALVHLRHPQVETGKYRFSLVWQGQQLTGLAAVILAHHQRDEAAPQPKKESAPRQKPKMDFGFFMRGGLVGAAMRGEDVGLGDAGAFLDKGRQLLSQTKLIHHLWGRCLDVFVLTTQPSPDAYDNLLSAFVDSIAYGPGYVQSQERERQLVNQINMQGAMDRARIQQQASANLSRTISQRNDMIMDSWNKRQAAQTRMSNNFSEAIRGVNSYTDAYGQKVEAGVQYDHMYQNGSRYVASDGNLDLGPDWTELEKNR